MNDGKRIIVVIVNEDPVADRRKIHARLNRVSETACELGENFPVFISYEIAVSLDCGYASRITVRSLRLRFFVLKPLIKSESSQFHIRYTYVSAWAVAEIL